MIELWGSSNSWTTLFIWWQIRPNLETELWISAVVGYCISSLFSLAFPRRSDFTTLHSRTCFYMTRLLSQNKQAWETKVNLFLFLPFSGPCWDCPSSHAAIMPGKVWMIDDKKLHSSISWVWLIPLWVDNHSLRSDMRHRHFIFRWTTLLRFRILGEKSRATYSFYFLWKK